MEKEINKKVPPALGVFTHIGAMPTSAGSRVRGFLPSLFLAVFSTLFFLFLPASFASTGTASWYSTESCRFNPHRKCPTASGVSLYELEKRKEFFFASWKCKFGKRYRITNTTNKRSIVAYCRDRGPHKKLGRIADLSKQAFAGLANPNEGLIMVNMEAL